MHGFMCREHPPHTSSRGFPCTQVAGCISLHTTGCRDHPRVHPSARISLHGNPCREYPVRTSSRGFPCTQVAGCTSLHATGCRDHPCAHPSACISLHGNLCREHPARTSSRGFRGPKSPCALPYTQLCTQNTRCTPPHTHLPAWISVQGTPRAHVIAGVSARTPCNRASDLPHALRVHGCSPHMVGTGVSRADHGCLPPSGRWCGRPNNGEKKRKKEKR
jgi:hypothetical protein